MDPELTPPKDVDQTPSKSDLQPYVDRYGSPPAEIHLPHVEGLTELQNKIIELAAGRGDQAVKAGTYEYLKSRQIYVRRMTKEKFLEGKVDAYIHMARDGSGDMEIVVGSVEYYMQKYQTNRTEAAAMVWADFGHEVTHVLVRRDHTQLNPWQDEALAMRFSERCAETTEENRGIIRATNFFEGLKALGVRVIEPPATVK